MVVPATCRGGAREGTPRTSVSRLFQSSKLSPLPGQPLWLPVAVRRSVLSSSAVPRPHGRGHWSSWRRAGERASSAQAATACRPARRTLQIHRTHAQFQPCFCCAASLCDRGQLRMPVHLAVVLPRQVVLSLRSASRLFFSEKRPGCGDALALLLMSSACRCLALSINDPGSWQLVCVACAFVSEGRSVV